jgi:hypothetical protein
VWVFQQLSGWKKRIRAANSLLNAEARKGNGGAPRTATDHNNDRTNDPWNNTSNSNGLTLRKTFALLGAASALSAIKMF